MDELLKAKTTDTDGSLGVLEATPESVNDGRWRRGLEWPAVLWIGVLHLGALTAPLAVDKKSEE